MNILVINADCLTKNSSANLCHLAYIKGLLESGHSVSVLSADGRDYVLDDNMQIPKDAHSYTFYGVSMYEKLSLRKNKRSFDAPKSVEIDTQKSVGYKSQMIVKIKDLIRSLYGPHGIYITFVIKAKKASFNEKFDIVLSISTPPASHLLAYKLIKKGKVHTKHWIQIWEDPWYSDAYGFNKKEKIRKEEKRLLSFAEKVCYVSPLTLENQKRLFPGSAQKMFWQPLPFYYQSDVTYNFSQSGNHYGYFGDYAPAVRDLEPFYMAAKQTGIEVNICGNPSDLFASTDQIHIHPRLPLNELKPIEDSTNVLVFLCNRKGGQIPGKIYQYSATNKTILFIMDGTEEEQRVLWEFFGKYNRYVFCRNTVDDIARAIQEIETNNLGDVQNTPLDEFNPVKTITNILETVR